MAQARQVGGNCDECEEGWLSAKMAMTSAQEIAGSVTGECIEGAVDVAAQPVMKSGASKLMHFGLVHEYLPWEIELTYGSSLDVFIETMDGES